MIKQIIVKSVVLVGALWATGALIDKWDNKELKSEDE